MKEKMKFRANRLLLVPGIVSFVIAASEGVVYYSGEQIFFQNTSCASKQHKCVCLQAGNIAERCGLIYAAITGYAS